MVTQPEYDLEARLEGNADAAEVEHRGLGRLRGQRFDVWQLATLGAKAEVQWSPLVGDGRRRSRPGRQVKEGAGRQTAGLLKIHLIAPIKGDEDIKPTFKVGVAAERIGIGHAFNVGAALRV
jgi:hypothetical protein